MLFIAGSAAHEDTCDLITRLYMLFFFLFGAFFQGVLHVNIGSGHYVYATRASVLCVYLVQTNICIGGTDTRFSTGKDIKFPLTQRLLSRLRLGQCVYRV